ncbi:MAG: hypothetical protein K6G88_11635 [Lachnospiraceae bacterium]|nr:hypothetical protein [Lachnospiraceae bacterium]
MLFANDENKNKVYIDDTNRQSKYYCPSCESELILRMGEMRRHHFAHASGRTCVDNWHYDMSDWHCEWQNRFPKECQEVVKEYNGKKHRADVLLENEKVVFEFQHSTLKSGEFEERNRFYNALGYRVIWIFDTEEQNNKKQIINYSEDKWKWDSAFHTFDQYDYKNKKVTIFLQLINGDGYGELIKVTWAAKDKGLSRFATDGISYNEDDIVHMFDNEEVTGEDIFTLWKEAKCSRAIFRKIGTNKYVKIWKDPVQQMKDYGKVYGSTSEDQYKFPDWSWDIYGVKDKEWILVWSKKDD